MPLYRPKELKSFLSEMGASPKKSLSQNFLIDGNIVKKILSAAAVHKGDSVLEIGGGPGVLTEALMAEGVDLTVVEKDHQFAEALNRFTLHLINGDILDFDLTTLNKGTKVVANLPYQLTTPILAHLLPRSDILKSVTVMVQKEVALRIIAKPDTKDYSSLTLFCQFYAEPKMDFLVSRNCFFPKPKVDSAVVTFQLKKPITDDPAFLPFMRSLFCYRRKTVRAILAKKYRKELIQEAFAKCQLSENVRPENLTLEDLFHFWQTLERLQQLEKGENFFQF